MSRSPIEFPEQGLGDGQVRLRILGECDLGALVEAVDEPQVARFTTMPSPYTEREARAWLNQTTAGLRAGTDLHPLIVDETSGELLGGCGVAQRPGDDEIWGIGYWVAAPHRGRGIASSAVRLIVPFAFDELGVARLELLAEEENPASIRTAQACGFTREGLLRSYLPVAGERRDMIVFSMLPGDPH